ncbi:hypothetical protein WMO40_09305, partial [Bacillaceae bacterium CLA-AA-H227]
TLTGSDVRKQWLKIPHCRLNLSAILMPRETALFLSNNYLNDIDEEEINLEEILYSRLRNISNHINYWEKVQLESIL